MMKNIVTRAESSDQNDRSHELYALYATARALTELGRVDDVLQSIVRQAHTLIGTDLVYLTVYENEERVMRAVEGTFSEEFRSARLEKNVGIAGLVEKDLAPAWTSDYTSDDRFRRSERFDYLMSLEGIVSVLGVPLLDNGEIRGVLFAGQRTARRFTPDEIAMFSAFANHASISLRNARLYEGSQTAVAELTRLHAVVEQSESSLRRANDVHDALTNVVLQGGSYDDVLLQLTASMGGDAVLFDEHRTTVAHTSSAPALRTAPTLPSQSSDATASARVSRIDLQSGDHAMAIDVVAGHERLGMLVHVSKTGRQDDEYILERCGQLLAMLLIRQREVSEAGQRVRSEVIAEILRTSGAIDKDTVNRARSRGIDVNSITHSICVAFTTPEHLSLSLRAANLIASASHVAVYGEHLGMLVGLAQESATDTIDALTQALREIGVADFSLCVDTFDPGLPVDAQLARTTRATRVAQGLGMLEVPVSSALLSPYSLLFEPTARTDLHRFLEVHLGALSEYDASHGSSLRATLRTFFANDGHILRTAKVLFIHQNTLLKRLGRIDELLGKDWRRAPRSTLIALATQLQQLRDETSGLGT